MEKHRWPISVGWASDKESSHRLDRATLDPAAWIRWKERIAIGMERAGARIEDVPLGTLKAWFERHISAEEAIRRSLNE